MIKNDSTIYHPIGAGSNVYKTCFLDYINGQLSKKKVLISIGAQPNSIPHFGTLIVFNLAFSLAKILMEKYPDKECKVLFEMVDTAPSYVSIINGTEYQRSLKSDGLKYLSVYKKLLSELSGIHGVEHLIRGQAEFNRSPHMLSIINKIINNRNDICNYLAPDTKNLRIRIACPQCGLSDKKAKYLSFKGDRVYSYCPKHGEYCIDYKKDISLLEYNTPLRNLIRVLLYMNENLDDNIDYEWIRITGSDYAGFYQEQTLYRTVACLGYHVNKLPLIIYSPLVIDWSGAKLSKSIYLKNNAYNDLPPYLLDYEKLKEKFGDNGLKLLAKETDEWIRSPYKLFRSYSVDYFKYIFEKNEVNLCE